MVRLDLDARRAEAQGEPHEVVLGGVTYQLPAEFPVVAGEYLASAEMSAAVGLLFGQDNVAAVLPVLTAEDINAIVDECYGFGGDVVMARPPAQTANGTNGNRAARRAKAAAPRR